MRGERREVRLQRWVEARWLRALYAEERSTVYILNAKGNL